MGPAAAEYLVLGPLEIRLGGATMPVRGRRAAVLAALLARAPDPVRVGRLEDCVWDGAAPRTAGHALHVYVSELRKLVGAEAIERYGQGYRIVLSDADADAGRFEALVVRARTELEADRPQLALSFLDRALGLWRGEPYADIDGDDAVAAEAERLAALRLAALEDRAQAALRLGRHQEIAAELEALCHSHPLRERLRAQLMLALYRCGRHAEALEHGRDGRALYADEGLEPTTLLKDLERAILRHEGTLLLPGSRVPAPRLPAPRTSFVGRGPELLELRDLLLGRDVRLLTLVGPPGIGKTRLALEGARALAADYADGVALAELGSITSAGLVATTIGHAAGSTDDPVAAIGSRRLLLVLDNFEHLLDAAPLVGRLVDRCHGLDVLATSRERLHLESEHVLEVRPLRLEESVALYRERARAAGRAHDGGVRELCVHLEGLPLAIELAAARADSEPPRRLDLSSAARDVDPRHATLRATIRWSFDRLRRREQRLLARLAIFQGGCTTDAAEAVTDGTARLLESLLDKSLLRLVDGRWTLLETIREFGLERLDEVGETSELRSRHARFFVSLVECAEPELRGPRQQAWLDRMEAEAPNIRAALRWWMEAGEVELVLRIACALAPYWEARGRWQEARRWLDPAADAPGLSAERVDAIGLAGRLAWYMGDRTAALPLLERSLELARKLDDPSRLALSLGRLSWALAEFDANYETAVLLAEQAVRIARGLDDERGLARVLNDVVGALSTDPHGDHELAQILGDEAVALWRRIGDPQNVVEALNNVGWVALVRGDNAEAETLLGESLAIASELGDVRHEMLAGGNLALLQLLNGDVDTAEERLRKKLAQAREVRDARGASESLRALAGVAAARGSVERAARLWGAAESLFTPQLTPPELAIRIRWIDALADSRGFRRERAAGAAMDLGQAIDYALSADPRTRRSKRGLLLPDLLRDSVLR